MIHAKKARGDYNNKTKLHFHFRIFFFNVEKSYYRKTNIYGRYFQFIQETPGWNKPEQSKFKEGLFIFSKCDAELIFTTHYLNKRILLLVFPLHRADLKAMKAKAFYWNNSDVSHTQKVRLYPADDWQKLSMAGIFWSWNEQSPYSNVIPKQASSSSGKLLGIQILGLHSRHSNQQLCTWSPMIRVATAPRGSWGVLKFED